MPRVKITFSTAVILQAVSRGHRHGFDIMDVSSLPDGTVYPALWRLEKAGLLLSSWEDEETARKNKRPARRYYELTAEGKQALANATARFHGLEALMAHAENAEPEGA